MVKKYLCKPLPSIVHPIVQHVNKLSFYVNKSNREKGLDTIGSIVI